MWDLHRACIRRLKYQRAIAALVAATLLATGCGESTSPMSTTVESSAIAWRSFAKVTPIKAHDILVSIKRAPTVPFVGELVVGDPTRPRAPKSTVSARDGVIKILPGSHERPETHFESEIQSFRGLSILEMRAGTRAIAFVGERRDGRARLEVYIDADRDSEISLDDRALALDDDLFERSAWTAVTYSGDALYLLDGRNLLVRRVTTSDARGIPTSLSRTIYLDSTQTHFLTTASQLAWGEGALGIRQVWGAHWKRLHGTLWVRDSDDDGRADEYHLTRP